MEALARLWIIDLPSGNQTWLVNGPLIGDLPII